MSRIVITAASRVGCVRNNNEDMVFAYDKFVRSEAYQTEFMTENVDRFVIALADGMGGHLAGEVASADTLENLRFFVSDMPKGLSVSEVNKAMEV
jgi:protein phosphatase